MRAPTADQERQICDLLEAMGPAEFYDSLISGGTFAVRNMFGCSDEDALAILGDLQGRQIITIETTPSGDERQSSAPQARFYWRRGTDQKRRNRA
jgi:hypothetical protein